MLRHFSHRHPLSPFEVEEEEEESLVCSGCELDLSGSAYKCNVRSSTCDFHLHKSCFELQRKIQHASHPQHRLTLLPFPPSRWGVFTCSACDGSGRGFTYHCKACDFDLHVQCSSLPQAVTRHDHQHPLALVFSLLPEVEEEENEHDDVGCSVCRTSFKEECWAYSCKDCDYVIHLDCVTDEACDDEVAEEQEEDEESQQVEDDHEDQSQEEEEEEDEEEDEEEEEKDEEEEDEDEDEEEEEEAEDEEEDGDEEAEQKEDEKTEDEEEDDDDEETEEDYDLIIARNIRRNAAVQMVINNQNARRMRMQQQMMLNNTRRLFQFGL